MISAITYMNIHQFGLAFSSQFKLRNRSFKLRQDYNVFSYNEMEYDQYDTPATVYLVYQSPETGEALGMSRLLTVSQGCMIKDMWPDLVRDKTCLSLPGTWESTRFCIEKTLPAHIRQKISRELVIAHLEFGLMNGVNSIIGVMPSFILNSVFKRAGCEFELLGSIKIIDGLKIQAAKMVVSKAQLKKVKNVTGIAKSVLKLNGENREIRKQAA